MSRATSFYYAFLVLPRAQREAIVAVWDFCRAVDDEVDEAEGGASADRDAIRAALQGWREEVGRCYEGSPQTSQGRHLQPWIRRFDLSRQPLEHLIDGVEMDLDQLRYPTFDALYEYCWRVASTVGFICIEIFGARSPAAREYALNLGIALQLTNIIRDVGSDAERGRIYVPQDDLARFNCSEAELMAGAATAPVRNLLAFECGRARDYYDRARAQLPLVDRRALVAAEIMGRIYRDTLRRVERSGYDVFAARIRAPRPRQAVLAIDTWMRMRLGFDVPA